MNLTLPANPSSCRTLPDAEFSRLKKTYPALWQDPRKTCPLCKKTGSFRAQLSGEIVTYDCSCVEQWKLHLWLLSAGIGHHYQKIAWHNLTRASEKALAGARDYLKTQGYDNGMGLTLWSPNRGTGKTSLGTLVMKYVMSQGIDCYSIQFSQMLDAFTAGWRSEEERAWYSRRIRNAGVLFVDEIGKEYQGAKTVVDGAQEITGSRSRFAETMVGSLLRERVAHDAPTIIGTNYTPAQIETGYGSDLVELLTESNIAVECSGPNYRPTFLAEKIEQTTQGLVQPFTIGLEQLSS